MRVLVLLRLAALGSLALTLSACGGAEKNAAGAKVFADAGCGGCHTLAAANTEGKVGPDLDQARPDAARVIAQVTNGGGTMPAFGDRLSEQQIRDVAEFVAESANTTTDAGSVAANYRPDGTTLADCTGDFGCYEQAFANIAYRQGPKAALALLERKIRSPGPIDADCHRITHAIGSGALAHFDGDSGAAFAAGGVTCASGYYHGIIERSLLGKPTEAIGPLTQSLCASQSIRRTEFIHFQCVHGLGHGLMIYTGYGLPRSLDYCDELETEWERESCRGGVFMENSQSSYGVRSRWLSDDDLIYPCNAVVQRAKYQCYLIQLARIGPALGFDWRRIAATCRESEQEFVVVCFQSIGREASGFTRHDSARILGICRFAGDMEDECIYGAARDITYNDAGPKRAKLFCNDAPTRYRAYCWQGIGTILGSLNTYREQRKAACRRATRGGQSAYYGDCIRGANV
ncbi:MAG: c-type cytochrome [Gaiellaceae bacterium]